MLILTRRSGESIYIGDDVIVTVTGVHGKQVRIGIRAPKNVAVDREEIRRSKEAASAGKSGIFPLSGVGR